MKIWKGYGSEHSANLVIIGEFQTVQKAQEVLGLLDDATRIVNSDLKNGNLSLDRPATKFSDEMLGFLRKANLNLNYEDPKQFAFEYKTKIDGRKLIVATEEMEVQAFIKIMIDNGAKLEVYSAHDHEGPYSIRNMRC